MFEVRNNELFIGLLLFLIPIISFLYPENLIQLSNNDLLLITISILIIFFIINIFSLIINIVFKKKFRYFFLILCFGYYLLFFFRYFYINEFSATVTLLILFIIWFFFVIFSFKFHIFYKLFKTFLFFVTFFYLLILIFSNFYSYYKYFKYNQVYAVEDYLISDSQIDLIKNSTKKYNIYYVILDSMMSLENAHSLNIINQNNQIKFLTKNNLKYINNTFSTYNNSMTISTIMQLDYLNHPDSKNDKLTYPYPASMHNKKNQYLLISLLKQLNHKFIWFDSLLHGHCKTIENEPWKCEDFSFLRNLKRLSNTIFINTPLSQILNFSLNKIQKKTNYQRGINFYLEYAKSNKNTIYGKNNFIFLHQFSPHPPYLVSENCEYKIFDKENNKDAYSSSYKCALKDISRMMKHIMQNDPDSIVIFQADHGIYDEEFIKKNDQLKYEFSIFNAIKAPDYCYKKYKLPKTSINTIRFVLNCAFDLDLPYLKNKNYRLPQFYFSNINSKIEEINFN